MTGDMMRQLDSFLDRLGISEEPVGLYYTDVQPAEGETPEPGPLPTLEKEQANELNWQEIFGNFSCAMGHIRRARSKKTAAYFSAEHYGCPGAAFWLGFNKPQVETIIAYVSSGIPGWSEGEFYCESPDELRKVFEAADPRPAPGRYCVVKPLSLFAADEEPEFVIFFARPESLSGLHQLAFYVTNDPEVVASPWSSACGGIGTWPQHYKEKGETKAVLGGWDPSARKFFRPDELSFTVPFEMFKDMLERQDESFLKKEVWTVVQKKIARSRKAWKEDKKEKARGEKPKTNL